MRVFPIYQTTRENIIIDRRQLIIGSIYLVLLNISVN